MYQPPIPGISASGTVGASSLPQKSKRRAEQIPVPFTCVPVELRNAATACRDSRPSGSSSGRNLLIQKCRQWRVEGGNLSNEVVERRRAQDGTGGAPNRPAAGNRTRCRRWCGSAPGAARPHPARATSAIAASTASIQSTKSRSSRARQSGGPSLSRTTLRRRSGRSTPCSLADDQGAEQVDPVMQVVVLRVDVDPTRFGFWVASLKPAGSRIPCWGCNAARRRTPSSIAGTDAPMDEFVQPLANRPGRRQAPGGLRVPRRRNQFCLLLDFAVDVDVSLAAQILQRRQLAHRRDAATLETPLVLLRQVRQQQRSSVSALRFMQNSL